MRSIFSYVKEQSKWIALMAYYLITYMGTGSRWVIMAVRLMIYGLLVAPPMLTHMLWYISTSTVVRRVRYRSSRKVKLEIVKALLKWQREGAELSRARNYYFHSTNANSGEDRVGGSGGGGYHGGGMGVTSPSPSAFSPSVSPSSQHPLTAAGGGSNDSDADAAPLHRDETLRSFEGANNSSLGIPNPRKLHNFSLTPSADGSTNAADIANRFTQSLAAIGSPANGKEATPTSSTLGTMKNETKKEKKKINKSDQKQSKKDRDEAAFLREERRAALKELLAHQREDNERCEALMAEAEALEADGDGDTAGGANSSTSPASPPSASPNAALQDTCRVSPDSNATPSSPKEVKTGAAAIPPSSPQFLMHTINRLALAKDPSTGIILQLTAEQRLEEEQEKKKRSGGEAATSAFSSSSSSSDSSASARSSPSCGTRSPISATSASDNNSSSPTSPPPSTTTGTQQQQQQKGPLETAKTAKSNKKKNKKVGGGSSSSPPGGVGAPSPSSSGGSNVSPLYACVSDATADASTLRDIADAATSQTNKGGGRDEREKKRYTNADTSSATVPASANAQEAIEDDDDDDALLLDFENQSSSLRPDAGGLYPSDDEAPQMLATVKQKSRLLEAERLLKQKQQKLMRMRAENAAAGVAASSFATDNSCILAPPMSTAAADTNFNSVNSADLRTPAAPMATAGRGAGGQPSSAATPPTVSPSYSTSSFALPSLATGNTNTTNNNNNGKLNGGDVSGNSPDITREQADAPTDTELGGGDASSRGAFGQQQQNQIGEATPALFRNNNNNTSFASSANANNNNNAIRNAATTATNSNNNSFFANDPADGATHINHATDEMVLADENAQDTMLLRYFQTFCDEYHAQREAEWEKRRQSQRRRRMRAASTLEKLADLDLGHVGTTGVPSASAPPAAGAVRSATGSVIATPMAPIASSHPPDASFGLAASPPPSPHPAAPLLPSADVSAAAPAQPSTNALLGTSHLSHSHNHHLHSAAAVAAAKRRSKKVKPVATAKGLLGRLASTFTFRSARGAAKSDGGESDESDSEGDDEKPAAPSPDAPLLRRTSAGDAAVAGAWDGEESVGENSLNSSGGGMNRSRQQAKRKGAAGSRHSSARGGLTPSVTEDELIDAFLKWVEEQCDSEDNKAHNRATLDVFVPMPLHDLLSFLFRRKQTIEHDLHVEQRENSKNKATLLEIKKREEEKERGRHHGDHHQHRHPSQRDPHHQHHHTTTSKTKISSAAELQVQQLQSLPPSSRFRDGSTGLASGMDPMQAAQIEALLRNRVSTKPFKVCIIVSGGAWIIGCYLWSMILARCFAAAGYVVFMPDYRNFPQTDISGMVEDVTDSIVWVMKNAEVYNGDAADITLIGHSAGAHLSLLTMIEQARACHAEETFRAAEREEALRRARQLRAQQKQQQQQLSPTSSAIVGPIVGVCSAPTTPPKADMMNDSERPLRREVSGSGNATPALSPRLLLSNAASSPKASGSASPSAETTPKASYAPSTPSPSPGANANAASIAAANGSTPLRRSNSSLLDVYHERKAEFQHNLRQLAITTTTATTSCPTTDQATVRAITTGIEKNNSGGQMHPLCGGGSSLRLMSAAVTAATPQSTLSGFGFVDENGKEIFSASKRLASGGIIEDFARTSTVFPTQQQQLAISSEPGTTLLPSQQQQSPAVSPAAGGARLLGCNQLRQSPSTSAFAVAVPPTAATTIAIDFEHLTATVTPQDRETITKNVAKGVQLVAAKSAVAAASIITSNKFTRLGLTPPLHTSFRSNRKPRFNPNIAIRQWIGVSGIYDLPYLEPHFNTRGLYSKVLYAISGFWGDPSDTENRKAAITEGNMAERYVKQLQREAEAEARRQQRQKGSNNGNKGGGNASTAGNNGGKDGDSAPPSLTSLPEGSAPQRRVKKNGAITIGTTFTHTLMAKIGGVGGNIANIGGSIPITPAAANAMGINFAAAAAEAHYCAGGVGTSPQSRPFGSAGFGAACGGNSPSSGVISLDNTTTINSAFQSQQYQQQQQLNATFTNNTSIFALSKALGKNIGGGGGDEDGGGSQPSSAGASPGANPIAPVTLLGSELDHDGDGGGAATSSSPAAAAAQSSQLSPQRSCSSGGFAFAVAAGGSQRQIGANGLVMDAISHRCYYTTPVESLKRVSPWWQFVREVPIPTPHTPHTTHRSRSGRTSTHRQRQQRRSSSGGGGGINSAAVTAAPPTTMTAAASPCFSLVSQAQSNSLAERGPLMASSAELGLPTNASSTASIGLGGGGSSSAAAAGPYAPCPPAALVSDAGAGGGMEFAFPSPTSPLKSPLSPLSSGDDEGNSDGGAMVAILLSPLLNSTVASIKKAFVKKSNATTASTTATTKRSALFGSNSDDRQHPLRCADVDDECNNDDIAPPSLLNLGEAVPPTAETVPSAAAALPSSVLRTLGIPPLAPQSGPKTAPTLAPSSASASAATTPASSPSVSAAVTPKRGQKHSSDKPSPKHRAAEGEGDNEGRKQTTSPSRKKKKRRSSSLRSNNGDRRPPAKDLNNAIYFSELTADPTRTTLAPDPRLVPFLPKTLKFLHGSEDDSAPMNESSKMVKVISAAVRVYEEGEKARKASEAAAAEEKRRLQHQQRQRVVAIVGGNANREEECGDSSSGSEGHSLSERLDSARPAAIIAVASTSAVSTPSKKQQKKKGAALLPTPEPLPATGGAASTARAKEQHHHRQHHHEKTVPAPSAPFPTEAATVGGGRGDDLPPPVITVASVIFDKASHTDPIMEEILCGKCTVLEVAKMGLTAGGPSLYEASPHEVALVAKRERNIAKYRRRKAEERKVSSASVADDNDNDDDDDTALDPTLFLSARENAELAQYQSEREALMRGNAVKKLHFRRLQHRAMLREEDMLRRFTEGWRYYPNCLGRLLRRRKRATIAAVSEWARVLLRMGDIGGLWSDRKSRGGSRHQRQMDGWCDGDEEEEAKRGCSPSLCHSSSEESSSSSSSPSDEQPSSTDCSDVDDGREEGKRKVGTTKSAEKKKNNNNNRSSDESDDDDDDGANIPLEGTVHLFRPKQKRGAPPTSLHSSPASSDNEEEETEKDGAGRNHARRLMTLPPKRGSLARRTMSGDSNAAEGQNNKRSVTNDVPTPNSHSQREEPKSCQDNNNSNNEKKKQRITDKNQILRFAAITAAPFIILYQLLIATLLLAALGVLFGLFGRPVPGVFQRIGRHRHHRKATIRDTKKEVPAGEEKGTAAEKKKGGLLPPLVDEYAVFIETALAVDRDHMPMLIRLARKICPF